MPDTIAAAPPLTIPFDNTYAGLPEHCFARLRPTPVAAPRLLILNVPLAEALGLDPEALAGPEGVAMLGGNHVPDGAAPMALAYAGHQFGQFVPQLGDGRALLLGEVVGRDGGRRDIQMKGSGPTPFSRRGDGRAALGPVLREYLVSEAMAALGVPTTRALAAVATGEPVYRDTVQPGAVLTRIAASHLRVGTFQYFAVRRDEEALRALTQYALARHFPKAAQAETPAVTLLDAVIARQASLVAHWLLTGFIHGVMNTDNTAISGETIDYGPCAFVDDYHPGTVFSSIDHAGRYAFGNQPAIARWNLVRLAEALFPLLGADEDSAMRNARTTLETYRPRFEAAYHAGLRRKLGLFRERAEDVALADDLLTAMAANGADFTLTFRRLGEAAADPAADAGLRALFADPAACDAWLARWRARLAEESVIPRARRAAMHEANPAVIPRNHLVQQALDAALNDADLTPFTRLEAVLAQPFEEPADPRFTQPPRAEERVLATFCGT